MKSALLMIQAEQSRAWMRTTALSLMILPAKDGHPSSSYIPIGTSLLTGGIGRSVEKSLEQLHVFDVMDINRFLKAHHEPL